LENYFSVILQNSLALNVELLFSIDY